MLEVVDVGRRRREVRGFVLGNGYVRVQDGRHQSTVLRIVRAYHQVDDLAVPQTEYLLIDMVDSDGYERKGINGILAEQRKSKRTVEALEDVLVALRTVVLGVWCANERFAGVSIPNDLLPGCSVAGDMFAEPFEEFRVFRRVSRPSSAMDVRRSARRSVFKALIQYNLLRARVRLVLTAMERTPKLSSRGARGLRADAAQLNTVRYELVRKTRTARLAQRRPLVSVFVMLPAAFVAELLDQLEPVDLLVGE